LLSLINVPIETKSFCAFSSFDIFITALNSSNFSLTRFIIQQVDSPLRLKLIDISTNELCY
jgi:hypothetical protein